MKDDLKEKEEIYKSIRRLQWTAEDMYYDTDLNSKTVIKVLQTYLKFLKEDIAKIEALIEPCSHNS